MARITIRKLDDDLEERLRRRAARNGRSLEAELREILRDAVATEKADRDDVDKIGLGTRIARRFAGIGFRPGEIEEIRGDWGFQTPNFDE
jgi:plasmid stability protein